MNLLDGIKEWEKKKVSIVCKQGEKTKEILKDVNKHLGSKLAILCNRYQYRGILAEVYDDGIKLDNARAIEVSGPSNGVCPFAEDLINTSVFIPVYAIELVYQPKWCNAPLTGE